MKKNLSLMIMLGTLTLAPLSGTGEVSWIPIEISPSSFSTFAESSAAPLETRVCGRAGGGEVAIESRIKTCGLSEWIFLNTEKFYGFFLILR